MYLSDVGVVEGGGGRDAGGGAPPTTAAITRRRRERQDERAVHVAAVDVARQRVREGGGR